MQPSFPEAVPVTNTQRDASPVHIPMSGELLGNEPVTMQQRSSRHSGQSLVAFLEGISYSVFHYTRVYIGVSPGHYPDIAHSNTIDHKNPHMPG